MTPLSSSTHVSPSKSRSLANIPFLIAIFCTAKMTITTNAQERTDGRANLSEVRGRL